ncbi:MAG: hypothetical protein M3O70_16785 [Actinomycetota bacterium]|nr:hypothetical protein [Actinomycetota bacterium]
MVPCAYLRVFEPLDAFPVPERERWGRYVTDGRGLTVGAAVATECRTAAARLITRRPPSEDQAALVRRVGQRIHVCPLALAQRHAEALLAFRDALPEPAASAFVSRDEARAALHAVRRLRRPPHIQEASWEVPLRWFAAFAPGERHFVNPPEGTVPRLTYLTSARAALRRLDRAIGVVGTMLESAEDLVEALNEMLDWVANFDEDSLVELDYGGLVTCIPTTDLATDSSCEDLWEAIGNLERGDPDAAVAGYESLSDRWQLLRYRCRSN